MSLEDQIAMLEDQLKSSDARVSEVMEKLTGRSMRNDFIKRELKRVIGLLQKENVIGDARFRLRKELDELIEGL